MRRFEDKVVVVTGAAQGIGFAIARRFGREGAQVVIPDINEKGAVEAAQTLEKEDIKAVGLYCDVASKKSVDAAFAEAEKRFKTCHVLVNNAGAASETLLLDMTEEEWHHAIGVILNGTFFCTQAAARLMRKTGVAGAIVNIASQGWRTSKPGRNHYSAGKAAVVQFTRSSAIDLAPYNIRVNAISPGGVATGMSTYLLDDPAKMARYTSHVPLARLGSVDEIASVAAFLASDDASFMTAANLDVDGGKNALGSSLRIGA
ncbi:MAG: SDR family oxidoreductase [Armatimonadetes bacterium]|nr:SDR family oxidoreductase [Armatimonadota bacterium]